MNEAKSVTDDGRGGGAAPGRFILQPDIVLLSDPHGTEAEAIRTLRTHIIAGHIRDGRRGLAVCGASRGVGCSFVAVNLAVALSQIGNKTLLIDGDLRNPSVDAMIVPPAPVSGLHQCLSSAEIGFGDGIQHDILPGLSVMYSGGVAPNPQELLAGDRFKLLTDLCMRDYDVTIIDTPPGNSCADARLISSVVGYSLIVARRDGSFVNDQVTLARELRADRAQVLGTVLNEF